MRTKESVIALIREAFRDVPLGNGYGLRQAESHDNGCYDEYTKELQKLDAREKAEGWQSLKVEDLDKYYVALSFFDPEGMRFHLPAYMIFDLEDAFVCADILFSLTYVVTDDPDQRRYAQGHFSLLNRQQRHAVREYLLLIRDEMDEDWFERPKIEAALKLYWAEDTE